MDITTIEDEEVIYEIKKCFIDTKVSSVEWAKKTTQTDEQFVKHEGIITIYIARHFKTNCATVTRVLNKLVKKGVMLKDTNSTMNRWWPSGYLAEIKERNRTASSS